MDSTVCHPDAVALWEVCDFNPLTGILSYKFSGLPVPAHSIVDNRNYRAKRTFIRLSERSVYCAYGRFVYLWVHGNWPTKGMHLDHINHDSHDNRSWNLRCITVRENNQNRRGQGSPGVYWNKNRNKWQAQIRIGPKRRYLGLYVNEGDALHAYIQACEAHGYPVLASVYARLRQLQMPAALSAS